MVVGKAFHLKKSQYKGLPEPEYFECKDEILPELKDGEVLLKMTHLSVDPYMRVYMGKLPDGSALIGSGVGNVIESKSSKVPVGTCITAFSGWRTHFIFHDSKLEKEVEHVRVIPPGVEPSWSLGVLGLTGMTAYFGFLDICQPQPGETVLVNGAAGAVGSVVGQLAKLKGCTVVGCASTDAKCDYLKSIGYDKTFNYRTVDSLADTLKTLCPNGIDCFFDNVGGTFFDTTMPQMNRFGRISLCGAISTYSDGPQAGPRVHMWAIGKDLKIQGFMAPSYAKRYPEALKEMAKWIKEGKIDVAEHLVHGYENMPKHFRSLFESANTGKIVVKL